MRGPGCWLLPLPPPLSALLGASAARTRRRWDLSRGAETHAAAGGSAEPSRPAQPEVSARRRGGGAEAAGEEAGLGHLPGRRQGLPSARRPLPSRPRPRCGVGGGRGGGPGSGLGPGGRRGLGSSLPRGASPQLLLPLSREAAAPRLPPLPQAGPGGARRGSRGRRVRGQRPSPPLCDLPLGLGWPSAGARCSFFPASLGCFSAGEAGSTSSGVPFGVRPVRGASVPTHPDAESSAGMGAEAAVPCGRVAVLCVLHPAHVVGCLPPPPSIFCSW